MSTSPITAAVYMGGRVAGWAVLALLAGTSVYAITMVALNWSSIGV